MKSWPKGVSSVGIDDIDKLGVDANGKLYWDGKAVATNPFANLSFAEKAIAVAIGLSAIAGGVGGAAQGWAAYNQWACDVRPQWPSMCKPTSAPAGLPPPPATNPQP